MSITADRIIAVRTGKTVFRDGETVVKAFMPSYSSARVLREALNQAQMHQCGFNVPQVIGVYNDNGSWCIRYEYVRGKTIAMLLAEPGANTEKLVERLVTTQLEIHGLETTDLPHFKDVIGRSIALSGLEPAVCQSLKDKLSALPGDMRPINGDYEPGNVVVRENGSHCVLGWAYAMHGNGEYDAACTYLTLLQNYTESLAQAYLAQYAAASGTTAEDVLRWKGIAAAARIARSNAANREFLLHHIND